MTAVLLFAKAPRAGAVKTRLARDIGAGRALALYRAMGRRVADAVAVRYPVTVWFSPAGAEAEMRAWLGAHWYRAQAEGTLGDRLRHAFETHFREGDRPVIAIGADAPSVDGTVVAEAEAALRHADVVLGPAHDGGYYLIGLAAPTDAPFGAIPWGGPDVMARTVAACRAARLSFEVLVARRDVDTLADLEAEGLTLP